MKIFILVATIMTITACGVDQKKKVSIKDVSMSGIQSKGISINQSSYQGGKGLSVVCWNNIQASNQERANEIKALMDAQFNSNTLEFTSTENGVTLSVSKMALQQALQTAYSLLASSPHSTSCPNSGDNQYSILSSTF